MNFPRPVTRLIYVFSMILLASVIFANGVLFAVSLVPFLYLIAGLLMRLPSQITVERICGTDRVHVDETIKVEVEVRIGKGIGVVRISDVLPNNFHLAEGSNFKIIWKWPGEKVCRFSYSVKSTTTGTYILDNIVWHSRHCLYNHVEKGIMQDVSMIEVRPKLFGARKVRTLSTVSSVPMPAGSVSRMGIPTLEFKGLRSYGFGDSFKYINWKASSRNIYRGGFWPVVNDYDKEGKKNVWILLDSSNAMRFGTNVKNVFEYGIEAVSSLTDFYLKQNCFVAFSTYNGQEAFVYPGAGKKQYYRILTELVSLNTNTSDAPTNKRPVNLKETILTHKAYFYGSRPLFVLITRYSKKNSDEISNGILELTKYTDISRGRMQVMVVNIAGYDIVAEDFNGKMAAELLELRDKSLTTAYKKSCIWVDWNPGKKQLFECIAGQVAGI